MVKEKEYKDLIRELNSRNVRLVAVSKTKSVEEIRQLYDLGQRDFGENYVQELAEKQKQLPEDIRWHFIGHLQRNKVKMIARFIHLIQSVDSLKLLKEINKEAQKNNRVINCLLQIHIAQEETKFGLDENELRELLTSDSGELQQLKNVRIVGLMGMASLSEDLEKVKTEFIALEKLYEKNVQQSTNNIQFSILSCGMSSDYKIAIGQGSNMVRIGSLIFGERTVIST